MEMVRLIAQMKGGRGRGLALRMAKLKALALLGGGTVMVAMMVLIAQCRRGKIVKLVRCMFIYKLRFMKLIIISFVGLCINSRSRSPPAEE